MQNKPYPGLFVTVEGGDGAGKSTVSKALLEELLSLGHSVFATREPGGSLLSEHIRHLLLNPPQDLKIGEKSELFLFLAARLQHIEEGILPSLHAGKIVICDRFNDSTIAYQGFARHLGKNYVEKLCQMACEGLQPDVTIFLDIDPQEGLKRVANHRKTSLDRLEQEKLQFHNEVRQGFLHLADEYPERIHVIDASLSLDLVIKQAMAAISPFLIHQS